MTEQLDELTGAFGRAALTRRLELLQHQYRETGSDFAVAMVDVDHLKTINDVYGHAAGDATIRTVAQRSMHVLRGTDQLFRYGGDEFVILLPATTQTEAAAVLRRIRDHVVSSPIDAGQQLTITISVGVASSSEQPGADVADILLSADTRLLQAKRAGRNSLVSDDRPAGSRQARTFSETRLYGRDKELALVDAFLRSEPDSSRARTLQVRGVPGVGLSRFMQEAGIRAGIAGMKVRHLDVQPAHQSLHLRALELAYSNEISADASTEAVAARLYNDSETHGLVLLLEGGVYLDASSRQLLAERLQTQGTLLIEGVRGDSQAAFPAGGSIELAPLVRRDLLSWLGAATAGPIEPGTGNALLLAAGGLPGKLEAITRTLLASGGLKKSPSGLTGNPQEIAAAAEQQEVLAASPSPRLPVWETPLVGRNQFLELIRPTARSSRLLVLTGPGGIGKSRLAAQLALELSPEFPDGTDWVDLRSVTDIARLPRMLCVALGLEPADELDEVIERIAADSRLIVFDEADGIAGSAGVFSELLERAPGVRLIITSRMPLRLVQESVIEVPELAGSAGVELFRHGMNRQGLEDGVSAPEVEDLLDAIGYTPLSIELAAAWTRVYSPAKLAETLAEQPELLVQAPGLQSGTARFIDVTRQLMSPGEQEALGTLALAPAGFTVELARAAADASPFFLLALLERALLRREDNRFTVHAAIAERYRAGLRDPAVARQKLAEALSAFAQSIEDMGMGMKTLGGYRQVDKEEPNMVFAWRHLLDPPQPELLWPLVRVLRGYLDVRGRKRLALELFSHADKQLANCDDLELRGWVRESVALFQVKLGELDAGLKSINSAHELLEQHGPPGLTQAMAWNTSGLVHSYRDDQHKALEAFKESARIRGSLGDRIGEAQAVGNAVITLDLMGRPEEALVQLRAAIANYREVNHLSGLSLALGRQANMMRLGDMGTLAERESVAREGAELGSQLGYATGATNGYLELAEALLAQERTAEAANAFEEAAYWAELDGEATTQAELLERAAQLRLNSNT